MQRADRLVAIGLIFVSLGVAWKATELPVGILPKEGPGGGFLPFWLSLGIAAVSLMVLLQSLFRSRRSDSSMDDSGVFMSREGLGDLLRVGLPGMIMILLIGVISVYFSAALFIFYCLFIVGGHNIKTSVSRIGWRPRRGVLHFREVFDYPLAEGVCGVPVLLELIISPFPLPITFRTISVSEGQGLS